MKRSCTGDVDRRSFLTGAATTIVGVALRSPIYGHTYADGGLKVCSDNGAARGRLNFKAAGQPVLKKVCMLGASAVGKTSLVRRYVESIYGDKYLDTIGVKIDKKVVDVEGKRMVMLIWDIKAEDEFQALRTSYLRNASGVLLVVDGTRRKTLEAALDFHRRIREGAGPAPSVVLMFNKDDLSGRWEIQDSEIENLASKKYPVMRGSAKTGKGVEAAFSTLAAKMLDK